MNTTTNIASLARALIITHIGMHGTPPAAIYIGAADFKLLALTWPDDGTGEFSPPYLGERAKFRGVPIYRVDAEHHFAIA